MYQKSLKRFLDVLFTLVLALVFVIPAIFISLILFFYYKQKIFFIQERTGYLGQAIRIYKFRTMNSRCCASGNLLQDHLRVTKFGKFLRATSLDEIPQLFNVLKGDLSLVGPRPLISEYLPLYSEKQFKRHFIKPGLTGLAQIKGRNALSWEEKFAYDVFYVKNVSFGLDLKILAITVVKVLFPSKIEHSFPEKFTGCKNNERENLAFTSSFNRP